MKTMTKKYNRDGTVTYTLNGVSVTRARKHEKGLEMVVRLAAAKVRK